MRRMFQCRTGQRSGIEGVIGLVILIDLIFVFSLSGCRVAGGSGEIQIVTRAQTQSQDSQIIPTAPVHEVQTQAAASRAEFIVCEIKGQIASPGIYDLARGSRVSDLILRSGGVLDSGTLDWVNQARVLTDGEVVVIPPKGITRAEYDAMQLPAPVPDPAYTVDPGMSGPAGPVNINTASSTELETVPGIGPVTAQNIIDYRTANGPFAVLEDLKKVDRIGPKTFEKLKPHICIGP